MGKFSKWIGAGLGFTVGGPIGAILGFVAGSFIDGVSSEDVLSEARGTNTNTTQSGDFEISLLVLSAIVIKADGKIDQRELTYVRNYFIQMYGSQRASNAFKLFKGIIQDKKIPTRVVCMQIRQHLTHASRLQLIHFLFGIAKADNHVSESEVDMIRKIAGYLYVNDRDFESIKEMFYSGVSNAYVILEIDKNASNDEVKRAYRKMVKKHHPDKLQHLGEEHLKGAQEKFTQIQQAYETIQKERGM